MKIAKKWTTVGVMLDEEQRHILQQIAKEEGKSESGIVKVAIDEFLQKQAAYIGLKGLLTSGIFEELTPKTVGIIAPIIQKAFDSCVKNLDNAKEEHPEVARLAYQTKIAVEKMKNDIDAYADSKKPGKGRPNKDESKPKGFDTLESYNELKAIADEHDDEIKQKMGYIIAKAVRTIKKGEDPILQVTEDLKQLTEKKA
ncbi:MAG: hypothetical protein EX285_06045 [Thaumarchaeota archaeon]|nr:hypothetical protein [Nitrososphaerota archaeon]